MKQLHCWVIGYIMIILLNDIEYIDLI